MLNVIKLYLEVIILYVRELNLAETADIDSYNIRDQRVLLSCTLTYIRYRLHALPRTLKTLGVKN